MDLKLTLKSKVNELLPHPLHYHWSTIIFFIVISLLTLSVVLESLGRRKYKVKAPYIGYKSTWEPTWLLRLRFFHGAQSIVNDGYAKNRNSVFWIRRNDTDLLVIPNKYVDELRALPDTTASPIQAHIRNLLGKHSTTDLLLESDLHTRALQTRLTPNLGRLFSTIQDEHDFAMSLDLPVSTREWSELPVYNTILHIIARISARMFVGLPLCRNEDWLDVSMHYTENVFETVMTLRMFPKFLHSTLVWFLPCSYRIHRNLRRAKRLIIPLVQERLAVQAAKEGSAEKPDDMLQWMMDAADANEGQPWKLAHRQLVLTLGAIHTTTMAATHAIFDLCMHPEYIEILREEVKTTLPASRIWDKSVLTHLRKMDSFLKESQRFNPPNILAFNRVAMTDMVLSDGLQIPKGTHFVVPSDAVYMDPAVTSSPQEFDGLRWYHKRSAPEDAHRHQFTTTTNTQLHFGHGRFSCPGRFFASLEIKMILSHLLLNYDLQYLPNQTRPKNMVADDNIFPNQYAKLLIRRKAVDI